LEIDGLVVFPEALSADEAGALDRELEALAIRRSGNARMAVVRDVHLTTASRAIELIAEAAMLAFLRRALGDDLVCMSSSYARYEPGYPGMSLHTDCQPYGSDLFGPLASVPVSLRVFYYLHELTPERSPLRVVRTSHLCLHQDANPYQRFLSHPEEEVISCPAGSAVVMNPRLFHGVGANRTDAARSVYTLSYRPAWAGPVRRVRSTAPAGSTPMPPAVRALFKPPNSRRIDPRLPVRRNDHGPGAPAPLGPNRWLSVNDSATGDR
jgi:ectoine hydroxylase-related dioxygenase (phytanoyl-CoA dioxygenase family)